MPLTGGPFVLPSHMKARRSPSFGRVMAAYFEGEKWSGALINRPALTNAFDPEYDVWNDIPEEYRTPEMARFYGSANGPEDAQAITEHIRKFLENRRVLEEAGWGSYLTAMGINEIFDPLNIAIPGPAILHKGLKGYSFLRNMMRGAAAGVAAVGTEEAILQQAQPMRTGLESGLNIAGGALLAGMLGGAVGMIRPAAHKRLVGALERELNRPLRELDVVEVTPEGVAIKKQREPVYQMPGSKVGRDLTAGEYGPGSPVYKIPGQYKVALPLEAVGKTARDRLDDALAKGLIDEPVYRLARYAIEEIDPKIDENTTLEIVDAVRYATEEEMRREGLPANEPYLILGETRKGKDEQGRLRLAIKLYRGADADTFLEEWGHRWWWQTTENDRATFKKYANISSPVEASERFAKGFRDYFFAFKYREEIAGPLAYLFRKAKDVLFDLVKRIRKMRGAKIPKQITDIFDRGLQKRIEPVKVEPVKTEPVKVVAVSVKKKLLPKKKYTKKEIEFFRAEHMAVYEAHLRDMGKGQVRAEAKREGIPVGKRPRKELEAALIEKEQGRIQNVEEWETFDTEYLGEKMEIDETDYAKYLRKVSPGDYNDWQDSGLGFGEWWASLAEDRIQRLQRAVDEERRGVWLKKYLWDNYGMNNMEEFEELMGRRGLTEDQTAAVVEEITGEGAANAVDEAVAFQMRREQTETPEFKRWFGDSKVVDEDGNPLVVYHGTPGKKINVFGERSKSKTTGNITAYFGHFFTSSINEANRYSRWNGYQEGNIIDVYLQIKNPYEMPYSEFDSFAMYEFNRMKELDFRFSDNDAVKFRNEAKKQVINRKKELQKLGYDGIIVITNSGTVTEYIAFEPTQIKSAISNRGTFDPNNPDIRYQMRRVTMEAVASRLDEEMDGSSRLMPIRGLSAATSDAVLRYVEHVHPGARPFYARYSDVPGQITEQLVITPELQMKNKEGIATQECAEIKKRKHTTRFLQRTRDSIYKHFVNRIRRQRGEAPLTEAPGFWQTGKAKLNVRELREFRNKVDRAINELAHKRNLDEFEPDVAAAAREIGAITNEIGQMAARLGLLGEKGAREVAEGLPHSIQVWNHAMVRKHPAVVARILKENIPEATNDTIESILDSITGSPTGWLDEMSMEQAIDMKNIDGWTAEYFRHKDLDIDYRALIDVDVDGVKVDFLEMDAVKKMNMYLDSTMGAIALADTFGDVTMKKQFKRIYNSYAEKMRLMGEADQTAIRKERDKIFKDMLALRDLVAGTYDRHQTEMFPTAMRVSKALMSTNAMLYLGGVVTSSLSDVAKPLFRWGLTRSVPALAEYVSIFNTPEFKALRKEAKEAWGAAISVTNSELMWNLMDYDPLRGGTRIEQGIDILADQMGWVTGIDWWNGSAKEVSMYVALKSVLEIAEQVRAGKQAEVPEKFITHIASMGLGVKELAAVAEQVAQFGETYGPLILPNVQKWSDKRLASKFTSAMVKEIDNTISTPGVGDRPLWMHNFILQHAGQFKGFAMNTMRSMIVRGLQEQDARVMQGIIASAAMGGAIYTIKNIEAGQENTDNPAEFLLNCIDRGGLTAYLMDIDSIANRLSKGTFSLQSLVGGEGATRFSAKSNWDILAGPTAGTVNDLSNLMSRTIPHAAGGEMLRSDVAPIFRLIPYAKTPYIRWLMERWRADWQEELPVRMEEE